MSFKENPKHIYKQQQKTSLMIQEAQRKKKTHKLAMKESTLLSTPQPTSSLDQIHKILKHIEINGREPKFKRHNTVWIDCSLLKKLKNCIGAAVVFETNMNNYYRH
jgi:hypothetical protein